MKSYTHYLISGFSGIKFSFPLMKDEFNWAKLVKKFQLRKNTLKGIKVSFFCYNKKEREKCWLILLRKKSKVLEDFK